MTQTQQTTSKEPLYKVLNEKRTQGEWDVKESPYTAYYDIIGNGLNVGTIANVNKDNQMYFANAAYTTLAVNNLHILAEALENLLNEVADQDGKIWEEIKANLHHKSKVKFQRIATEAKQALNNIS